MDLPEISGLPRKELRKVVGRAPEEGLRVLDSALVNLKTGMTALEAWELALESPPASGGVRPTLVALAVRTGTRCYGACLTVLRTFATATRRFWRAITSIVRRTLLTVKCTLFAANELPGERD